MKTKNRNLCFAPEGGGGTPITPETPVTPVAPVVPVAPVAPVVVAAVAPATPVAPAVPTNENEKLRLAEEAIAQQKRENELLNKQNQMLREPVKKEYEKKLATAPEVIKKKFEGRKNDDPVSAMHDLSNELDAYEAMKTAAKAEVQQTHNQYQKELLEKFGIKLPNRSPDDASVVAAHAPQTAGGQQAPSDAGINYTELAKKQSLSYDEARLITSRLGYMSKYLAARRGQATSN